MQTVKALSLCVALLLCAVFVMAQSSSVIYPPATTESGASSAQGLGANFALSGGNTLTGVTEAKSLELRGSGGQATSGADLHQHSGGFFEFVCVVANVRNACNYFRDLAEGFVFGVRDHLGAVIWQTTEAGLTTFSTGKQLVLSNLGIELTESDTNPTCAANNYNIYADTSEAAIKMCRNGLSVPLVTSGLVRKTADIAVQSDVTPNNDADLLWAVDASSLYIGTAFIKYSTSTTADFRIDFAVPAGTTGQRLDRYVSNTATTCQGTINGQHNSLTVDTENGNLGGGGVGSICIAVIQFQLLTAGTAGNVVFMWAQATTDATDTTVYANSYIEWRKL